MLMCKDCTASAPDPLGQHPLAAGEINAQMVSAVTGTSACATGI